MDLEDHHGGIRWSPSIPANMGIMALWAECTDSIGCGNEGSMKPANHAVRRVLQGGLAMITALVIGGAGVTFAQESVAVRAAIVTGGLPVDDPNAEVWSSAPPATFPMSPQVHWPDRIQEVTVKDVIVRALHDDQQVAFLVEYSDPTQDPDDGAALEFMVGEKKAHFAHGQPMLQVEEALSISGFGNIRKTRRLT